MHNPFGTEITSDEISETLSFFDDWEQRYRYIIDLGKQLPEIEDSLKTESNLVRGCQSQVWIVISAQDDKLYFDVDSDAHIVRGLLALVVSAYNGRTPDEILNFDVEAWFEQLQLLKHLSPIRGNGLRAMVNRICQEAQQHKA